MRRFDRLGRRLERTLCKLVQPDRLRAIARLPQQRSELSQNAGVIDRGAKRVVSRRERPVAFRRRVAVAEQTQKVCHALLDMAPQRIVGAVIEHLERAAVMMDGFLRGVHVIGRVGGADQRP
jgi:hypothetical protein